MKPKRFKTQRQMQRWVTKNGRGRALHCMILHDDWCVGNPGGGCNCSPEFVIEDMTVDSLIEGEKQEQQWRERHKNN